VGDSRLVLGNGSSLGGCGLSGGKEASYELLALGSEYWTDIDLQHDVGNEPTARPRFLVQTGASKTKGTVVVDVAVL
jgi:hypothetical protein